jgi:hypothetical protein
MRAVRSRTAYAAVCASVLLGWSIGSSVSAQTCHAPSLRQRPDDEVHVGLTHLFATFSDANGSGSHDGLIPTVAWSRPWVTAELAVPVYRLSRTGDEDIGLGDIAVDVRVALLRTDSGEVSGGLELAAMLPTGDADRELGMGHVMLMPGVWARVAGEAFSVMAQLAYGTALGDGYHASHAGGLHDHHGGEPGSAAPIPRAYPRVNPMNGSELEHALALAYAVHPNLSLTARWIGALAVEREGTTRGVDRQLIGPGVQIETGVLDSAVEVQVPFVGDPFDFRLSVSIGAQL